MSWRKRALLLLAAGAAFLANGLVGPPARLLLAAPAPAPARQDDPGLGNGSFEGALNPWQSWVIVQGDDCAYQDPQFTIITIFGSDPLHVIEGHDALRISIDNDRSYWAGVRQSVKKVTPGMRLRFSVEMQWDANTGQDSTPSNLAGEANMRVGIDPTGGDSPTSSNIVWSAPENRQDAYYKTAVEAVARNGTITVFAGAHPTVCQENNKIYLDRAELEVLGIEAIPTDTPVPSATTAATAAPTAAPPTATANVPQATATPLLTPTPGADGAVIYTVESGDTLTSIAFAAGLTVQELQALNGLTDSNIRVGQQLLLATAAPSPTPTEVPTETPPPATDVPPTPILPTPTPVDPHGQVCVAMYEDEDADGVHDDNEALLAGGTLRLTRANNPTPVAEYETTGTGEPYCFEALDPMTYMVAAAGPEGYTLTRDEQIGVLLPPQGDLTIEFGAQQQAGGGLGAGPLAAAGVAVLLAAGGAAAFAWRRMRRAA